MTAIIDIHGREILDSRGNPTLEAEVTLTDRDEMGFRMLVGREALTQGYVVDPAVSYAGGRPPRAVRWKNWGRA